MPRKKISDEDVKIIRESKESQRALAERYGISQALISAIRLGKKRYNVDGDWPVYPDYRTDRGAYFLWRDGEVDDGWLDPDGLT